MRTLRRTKENQGEPRRTEENREEPRRTEENRGEPRRTEENRGEPRRTEENRGALRNCEKLRSQGKKRKRQKKNPPDYFLREISQKWQFLGKMSRFWSEGVFGTFSVFSRFPSKNQKNHKVGATEKGKEDRNEKNKEEWVRNDNKSKRRRLAKKGIWKRGEYEEKGADRRWWKERW